MVLNNPFSPAQASFAWVGHGGAAPCRVLPREVRACFPGFDGCARGVARHVPTASGVYRINVSKTTEMALFESILQLILTGLIPLCCCTCGIIAQDAGYRDCLNTGRDI